MNEVELYRLRYTTHKVIDALWKEGHMTRKQAYIWLAKRLRIKMYMCHVSMFDEKLCRRAIGIVNFKLGRRKKPNDGKVVQEQSTLPKV